MTYYGVTDSITKARFPHKSGLINTMMKYLITFVCLIACFISQSQKLEIVPNVGFQYYGLSYLLRPDAHPEDFKKSRPEFEGAIGVDVKYKSKKLTHVLGLQNPIIGPSFSFRNIYSDKGIIPTFLGYTHSSGPNQIFLSYTLQNEGRKFLKLIGKTRTKLSYSGGFGIGFNKSKDYYETVLQPYSLGGGGGDNYYRYTIRYNRAGMGMFFPIRAGLNFYNRRKKNFLALQVFWNQGLKKMAEYSIDYDYGYYSYPQYQRSVKDVRLKSRGTTFGCTLGVPIRILK